MGRGFNIYYDELDHSCMLSKGRAIAKGSRSARKSKELPFLPFRFVLEKA
jgi:hypothetical protein